MKKPSRDFYAKPTEASRRKQRIVVKYHAAWSQVLRSRPRASDLAYVDLFAGPGKYGDGSLSTPLMIIEAAAQDTYMREHLLARFNEGDPQIKELLQKNLDESAAARELKHRPRVTCARVEQDILKTIGGIPACPTLLFADPWGYKGLSIGLLTAFLKPFGNDLIFFFNYNRIASGLHAPVLDAPIDAVFGTQVADDLRKSIVVRNLKGADKEREIMNALGQAFSAVGGQTPVQFPFQTKGRLSHHLMFISKHPLGSEIMKGVMAAESTPGVFGYDQAAEDNPLLFTDLPLENLARELHERFVGRTVRFGQLGVERHPQLGIADHKRAIQKLERQGHVIVVSYARTRRLGKDGLSIPDDAILVFGRGDGNGAKDANRMD